MGFQGRLCLKQIYVSKNDKLDLHHGIKKILHDQRIRVSLIFKFLVTREKTYLYKIKYL